MRVYNIYSDSYDLAVRLFIRAVRSLENLENLEMSGDFILVRENLENLEKSGDFVEITPQNLFPRK